MCACRVRLAYLMKQSKSSKMHQTLSTMFDQSDRLILRPQNSNSKYIEKSMRGDDYHVFKNLCGTQRLTHLQFRHCPVFLLRIPTLSLYLSQ